MTISSRTPEGEPNACPLCGHDLRLEPSIYTRDGPCPSCGHLLWFSENDDGQSHAPRLTYESFIIRTGKKRLGEFPVELQVQLIQVIAAMSSLARRQKLLSG